MTPSELVELARTPEHWGRLVAVLAPLDEAGRAALAPAARTVIAFDTRNPYDSGAGAILACGLLDDVRLIAAYAFYFRTVPVEAEPSLLQVLRDRRPRWLPKLVAELLRPQFGSWRPAWLLVREGLVPTPRSRAFLTEVTLGVPSILEPDGWQPAWKTLRADPALLDSVVWPMLLTPAAGRTWVRPHPPRGTDPQSGEASLLHAVLDQVATGGMDRDRLIDTLLRAFLMDLPKADLPWYVQAHDALQVTVQEALARAPSYGLLLASSYGPAVALAQARFAALLDADRLDADVLIDASPGVLTGGGKANALAQLQLLARVGTAAAGEVAALALEHPQRAVQDRARTLVARLAPSAQPVQVAVVGRSAVPQPRPAPSPVLPVADAEELLELVLRMTTAPDAIGVERAWEGLTRIVLAPRDVETLAYEPYGFSLVARSGAGHEPWNVSQGEITAHQWTPGGEMYRAPRWRPEQLMNLRRHELLRVAATGAPVLSFPSADDGTVAVDDLLGRLARMPDGVVFPMDAGLAALRLEPGVDPSVLRGTATGDYVADRVERLRDHAPLWERVTWVHLIGGWINQEQAPRPTVWQDSRSAVGSQDDLVAALLDRAEMTTRFGQSLEGRDAYSGSLWVDPDRETLLWPLLLPHHPELLAAHAHARLLATLDSPGVYYIDPKRSGSHPLLTGLGRSRQITGPVAASALVVGLSAVTVHDRATATDAVIELATHGLLDGVVLAGQVGVMLGEGFVKGSRIAARGRARAIERLEHALELGRRDARAAIYDAHDHAPSRRTPAGARCRRLVIVVASPVGHARQPSHSARAHRHRMPARVAPCVLEHVHERALHLHRIDAHERQLFVDRQAELLGARAQLGERRADQLLDRSPVAARLRRAGFQAREVEQVVDESREPLGLLADHRRELALLLL